MDSDSNSSNSDVNIDKNVSWLGCSMKEVYRNLSEWELKHVPPVHPSDNHTVLYHWPLSSFNELPKPQKGFNKWDSLHVRLPCSSKSQYPVTQTDGTVGIENRWLMIEKALLRPIKNSKQFEAAVLSYNSKYQNVWKFRTLHIMFEEEFDEEETEKFFEDLLPKIIRLALRLPKLVASAIPLLKQGQNRSISLSQQQVACLLANAFLCTFPRRNTTKKKSEYSSFPDINFNRLFQSSGHQVIEKLKCILNYFRRVCDKMPTGILTFTRRSLTDSELPNWMDCNISLGSIPLHVTSSGTIEDQGQGLLQVDFANKFLGGGVLGSGCVQEEIRFVICPELIISKLFTEALRPCEALVIIGCEQFSKYIGYASSFKWNGNFEDNTPFDESGRRKCHIVAIDALYFSQSSHQYREESILRELNKAYVGFIHSLDTLAPGVASGNWGCGAFGGESSLKALIQLMACAVTKRPLVYFTFGNRELRDNLFKMHKFFVENNVKVKQLWKYLTEFHGHKLLPNDLYSYIIQAHCDYQKTERSSLNGMEKLSVKTNLPVKLQDQQQEKKSVASNNNILEDVRQRSSSPEELRYEDIVGYSKNEKSTISSSSKIDKSKFSIISRKPKELDWVKLNNKLPTTSKGDNDAIDSDNIVDVKLKDSLKNLNSKILKNDNSNNSNENCLNETKTKIRTNDNNLIGSQSSSVTPKKSKSERNIKTTTDLKQRSLLDMLDVFYSKETEKPAKRYCGATEQDEK